MKFMIIGKATNDTEACIAPKPEEMEAMGKYIQEMIDAGILVEATGLEPSAKAVRINCSGDKRSVVHGPFAETNELIAGFVIIDVPSMEEAIEWVKRGPNPRPGQETQIEIRKYFEWDGGSEA